MATFVSMLKFTAQGVSNIQDTTRRAAAFKAAVRKMGVRVTGTYWTMGEYDGLVVFDAADDESAAAAMAYLASHGNVQTRTTRAFTGAEMDKVLATGLK
jgi:uncharacterized protein with GYD domain